ncbi:MAG: hypothetical protein ABSB59_28005 [Streptosporangiaceae bacterium]|jgi:hypothetical protein
MAPGPCGKKTPAQVTEQAAPGEPHDFRFDAPRRDSVLAQDTAGRLGGAGQGEQVVLAAEISVMAASQSAGVLVSIC